MVLNRTGPNSSAEVIAFQPKYWRSFSNSKRKIFFFCDMKRVAGMVVLQKLGKALVHSDYVTMNMCFFKVEKRWLYSSHCFPRGSCGSSARRLVTGSTARVRSRVSEGWRFSSLLHVKTAPGVHSASYKMSAGGKYGRVGLATLPHPSAVTVYMCTLESTSLVGLHGL